MARKQRSTQRARAEPSQKRSAAWLCSPDAFETLACQGYTSLAHNPEICSAVDVIARLIGSMTIHLMQSTDKGDLRVKNELSRKVDINPNSNMTRASFVHWIIKNLYLDGNGNVVVYPETRRGILRDLQPIPPAYCSYLPDGLWGYKVAINGKEYDPDDVLHFTLNPDSYYPWLGTGYKVSLADVANNLKQAAKTEKGFMESKWKPSLIIKVDALT